MAWRRRAGETYHGGRRIVQVTSSDGIEMIDFELRQMEEYVVDNVLSTEYQRYYLSGVKIDNTFIYDSTNKLQSVGIRDSGLLFDYLRKLYVETLYDSMMVYDDKSTSYMKTELIIDKLFSDDKTVKTLQSFSVDSLLINSIRKSLLQALNSVDNLLLTDNYSYSLDVIVSKIITDAMAIYDDVNRVIQTITQTPLLLNDIKYTYIGKYSEDKIILDSIRSKLFQSMKTDGLLVSDIDSRLIIFVRNILDSFLLSDTEISENIKTRLQTDGIFLTDIINKVLLKIDIDNTFIGDDSTATLFAAGGALIEKLITDKILTNDYKNLLYAILMTDKLFVEDGGAYESIIELVFTDYSILNDSAGPLQEISKIVINEILLSDNSFINTQLSRVITDLILLYDTINWASIKDILVTDIVLIGEKRQGTILKKIEDRVVLSDYLIKEIQKFIIDQSFLGDSSSFVIGSRLVNQLSSDGVILYDITSKLKQGVLVDDILLSDEKVIDLYKLFTDSLILEESSFSIKQSFLSILDSMELSDSVMASKLKEIIAIDSFLMFDLRLTELRKVIRDNELTADIFTKLLQSTKLEDMFVGDSTSKLLIGAIIAFLIYARLSVVNHMNIEFAIVDYLNIKYDMIDYLGRTIGIGPVPRYD